MTPQLLQHLTLTSLRFIPTVSVRATKFDMLVPYQNYPYCRYTWWLISACKLCLELLLLRPPLPYESASGSHSLAHACTVVSVRGLATCIPHSLQIYIIETASICVPSFNPACHCPSITYISSNVLSFKMIVPNCRYNLWLVLWASEPYNITLELLSFYYQDLACSASMLWW